MENSKKALVFGGGGALGAYEVGVWSVLDEHGYKPDIVTGTSVGALNAAMYAQKDYPSAYKMWKSITTDMVFDIDRKSDDDLENTLEFLRVAGAIGKEALLHKGADTSPLRGILSEYVKEDLIRKSDIELGSMCFSVKEMTGLGQSIHDMKKGSLIDWLMASAAIFPAARACKIEDRFYIDGGFYDTIPCELAESLGAQELLAVDLHAIGRVRKPKKSTVTKIESEWPLGSELFFTPEISEKLFALGRLDAMKYYGEYEGVLYAFCPGFCKTASETARRAAAKIRVLSPHDGDGLITKGTFSLLAGRCAKHLRTLYKYHDGAQGDNPLRFAENAAKIFGLEPERSYTSLDFDPEILSSYASASEPADIDFSQIFKKPLKEFENLDESLAFLRAAPAKQIASAFVKRFREGFKNEAERSAMRLVGSAFPAEFLAALYILSI